MSNATMQLIAQSLPKDEDALLAIKGIGMKFIASYGASLLGVIRSIHSNRGR
jgi:superfamily II DNA helicase RecQ